MSKVISFLSAATAVLTTLASVLDLTKPQYAVTANLVAAALGAAGGALAKGFPGGRVATVLGAIGAAVSAVLSFSGVIAPEVARYLTALGAAIAAFGESLVGWEGGPSSSSLSPPKGPAVRS